MLISRLTDCARNFQRGVVMPLWPGVFTAVVVLCLSAQACATLKVGPDVKSNIASEIEAQLVAMQLDQIEGRRSLDSKSFTSALIDFYQQRQYRPLWNQANRLEQLIHALDALEADGLTPQDYQLQELRHALLLLGDDSPETLTMQVADELRATNAYLRALYHLYHGKVDSAGLAPQWDFELHDMAPIADVALLIESIETGQIARLFEQTPPQHPTYRSFKAGLQQYRRLAEQGGWPSLPVGETLKPCMVDPSVAILRQRLRITGEYVDPGLPSDDTAPTPAEKCLIANAEAKAAAQAALLAAYSASAAANAISEGLSSAVANQSSSVAASLEPIALAEASSVQASSAAPVNPDDVFDEYLVDAVKQFQAEQYLDVDGVIGPATRAALNVSVQARIDQIRVNLDRARWLLHNIPPEMLLVDVAGFKVTYFKASQPIWRSRVQVGMAYRTTPIFRSEVNYLTLNPTWTVPPTILRKDILPKVRQDLNYLRERNIRVLDSSGREVDPATVDWHRPGNITLRQDAGDDAALGKVVIRFPNSHSVYLHDTPHQRLFNKSQRAFSSGCIRVERVLELVELLLAETPGWDSATINKALATGKTRNVTLVKRVPILLAYWTVDALDETRIAFKPDIYARDPEVLASLDQH